MSIIASDCIQNLKKQLRALTYIIYSLVINDDDLAITKDVWYRCLCHMGSDNIILSWNSCNTCDNRNKICFVRYGFFFFNVNDPFVTNKQTNKNNSLCFYETIQHYIMATSMFNEQLRRIFACIFHSNPLWLITHNHPLQLVNVLMFEPLSNNRTRYLYYNDYYLYFFFIKIFFHYEIFWHRDV